jgi:hypothetical protein
VDQVLERVAGSLSQPVESAGYWVELPPDEAGYVRRYRFENVNYTQARQLRGDSNNLTLILLRHMLATELTDLDQFLRYYPIYQPYYNQLVAVLKNTAELLYSAYGLRYKLKQEILVPARHQKILGEIHHNLYLGHLKPLGQTVKFEDILNFIWNQAPERVLYIINYMYE